MHDAHEEIALKALSHGVRVRILDALHDVGEASPSVIARDIGETTETVANHVKLLTDWGLLEHVRVEQRGQRRSNIYRITSAAAPTLGAWRQAARRRAAGRRRAAPARDRWHGRWCGQRRRPGRDPSPRRPRRAAERGG